MWSKLGSLKLGDWWRGLIVAIATTPITIILQSIDAESLVFDWKAIIMGALAGGLGYILKNLGTGSAGNILTNK